VSVTVLNSRCLSEADVIAVRPHILSLIRRGLAKWWDLDMGTEGYASISVLGQKDDLLFEITKRNGAYRVVDVAGRPMLQSRRLENVLAVLP
jgi:hypothetical protein